MGGTRPTAANIVVASARVLATAWAAATAMLHLLRITNFAFHAAF